VSSIPEAKFFKNDGDYIPAMNAVRPIAE